eukprot:COSAG02_NODE_4828_length_4932_cov_37.882888_7_plen_65_part_00
MIMSMIVLPHAQLAATKNRIQHCEHRNETNHRMRTKSGTLLMSGSPELKNALTPGENHLSKSGR